MRVSKRLISLLILISTLLAACRANSPADLREEQVASSPTPEEATPTAEILLTSTPLPTATPVPSPTPTPLPEIIEKETLPLVQVVSYNYLDTGELTEIKRKVVSSETRLAAVWGCYLGKGSISTCEKPLLAIMDVDSGKKLFELEPLTTIVEVMQFSPDNRILAIAGCHTPIYYYGEPDTSCTEPRVWMVDTTTGEITYELKRFSSAAKSLVFSPDGSRLYTSVFYFKKINYTDNSIRIWDVASGDEIGEIHPDITNCTQVTLGITPDGHYLITRYVQVCTGELQIKWWNLVNPSQRAVAGSPGYRFAVSPDSTKIAILESPDNLVIHVFDLQSGKRLLVINTGLRGGNEVRFSFTPDNKSLLLTNDKGANGNGFTLIDIESGQVQHQLKASGYILDARSPYAFSPDGNLLLTFGRVDDKDTPGYSSSMSAWDTTTWEEYPLTQVDQLLMPYTDLLAFSPDQKYLVAQELSGREISRLGLPVQEQAAARTFLVDYLNLLAEGNYSTAAEQLVMDEILLTSDWLASELPGVDLTDNAAILETLCRVEDFPCLPPLEISYQSRVRPGTFLFEVQFAGSDGKPVIWPPCADAPEGKYCDFRTDFEYTVVQLPDGGYKIFNTFPYSLYLDQ